MVNVATEPALAKNSAVRPEMSCATVRVAIRERRAAEMVPAAPAMRRWRSDLLPSRYRASVRRRVLCRRTSCCSIDGCCDGECFGEYQYCCLPESSAYCGDRCCDPTSEQCCQVDGVAVCIPASSCCSDVDCADSGPCAGVCNRISGACDYPDQSVSCGDSTCSSDLSSALTTPVMEQETALKSVRYAHHLPVLGVRVRPYAAKARIVRRASATTIRVAVRLATSVSSPIRAAVRLMKTRVSRAALLAAVIVSTTAVTGSVAATMEPTSARVRMAIGGKTSATIRRGTPVTKVGWSSTNTSAVVTRSVTRPVAPESAATLASTARMALAFRQESSVQRMLTASRVRCAPQTATQGPAVRGTEPIGMNWPRQAEHQFRSGSAAMRPRKQTRRAMEIPSAEECRTPPAHRSMPGDVADRQVVGVSPSLATIATGSAPAPIAKRRS